jgi:heptosyltransferase-2
MATSSFADARRAFPGARISILLKPGRERILEGSTDHDRIIHDPGGNGPGRLWALARALRKERFDMAIVLPTSFRSALVPFLAGIPRRFGYGLNGRSLLLTDVLRPEMEGARRRPVPMPIFYSRVCELAGIPAGDGRPRLSVTPACEERARAVRESLEIREGEPVIGLNPGASFGSSKLWPSEHFARLADLLTRRYGSRTMILVGPGEERIAEEIISRAETRPIYDPAVKIGLDVLKPVVRDLKLLVTTDTGPRHYAVAFGTPVVCVMGSTDPRYTALNLERTEVVRHDVPCGPCHLKTCPIDHRCMVGIGPEEVVERVEALHARVGVFR